MTEQQTMLADMVKRLFGEMMASGMPEPALKDSSDPLWNSLEEIGLTDIFLPEDDGGFGGNWQDAFFVINQIGFNALPLPLAETMASKKLLQESGMNSVSGAVTMASCSNATLTEGDPSGTPLFSGNVKNVAWGSYCSHLLLAFEKNGKDCLVLMASDGADDIEIYVNDAGEQRCDLSFTKQKVIEYSQYDNAVEKILMYGALLRSMQISGALEAIFEKSVGYVNERSQFGRTLSKFQVIQHQLALLAEDVAVVKSAVKVACLCADTGDFSFEIAATKLISNKSIPQATSIAHQSHGAIGFTLEHPLHYFTQRLWSWRSEFGNDRYWSGYLGKKVIAQGSESFWASLTEKSDSNIAVAS